ncbi:MAG: hypothetical protein ACMUHB_03355 [Thermoplasmatota archaeon]
MVDYEYGKIKTGLFSGKSVGYESKLVRPTSTGEVRSLTMYDYDTSKRLGSMEYEIDGNQVKVNGFSFADWSDPRLPEGFIKYFMKKMKKRGVSKVTVELYDTDANTHNKLTVFKSLKFTTDTTGNMTGYQSWLMIRTI